METETFTAVFNRKAVLWSMEGNLEDAKALLSSFLLEARKLARQIEEDITTRNALALRIHSEELHESASEIYSLAIKYFANRLGGAAESYDFATASRMLNGLNASLKILDKKLRAEGWL